MNFADPTERDALAAEYVVGLLPLQDHAEFERTLAHDMTLARAVYAWQDRMLAVAPMPGPVAPAPDSWKRIAGDLGPAARRRRADATANDAWWSTLVFWRWTSALAVATSIVLAWMLLVAPALFAGERYVAILLAPDNNAAWIVEADRREVRLRPLTVATVGPRQALQFWTKPDGAAGPTSLGLIPADRTIVIPTARLPGLGANQLFEVTLEPETGSPIGRPTGPVLAVGRAARI
jgi:anti-sigma-K factor RskA